MFRVNGPTILEVISNTIAGGSPPPYSDISSGIVKVDIKSATDTNGVPEAPRKTIVDQTSGQYAVVDARREVVSLMDKNDNVIWSTNVIEALAGVLKASPRANARSSGSRIQGLQVENGNLVVALGRA